MRDAELEALERLAKAAGSVLLLVDRHEILLVPAGPQENAGTAFKAIGELRAARDNLIDVIRRTVHEMQVLERAH